ncbi:MAG: response regulator [Victivallaceae bacterium]|nr:response regulator [Victivallaceae bacterium]
MTIGSVRQCDGASEPVPVRSSAAATASAPEDFSVLPVDDVEMNLRVMSALCRRVGLHNIAVASTGSAALAKMAEQRFDLILTDMWMPGMNGAELAGR